MDNHILPSKLTIGFLAFLSLVLVAVLTKDNIEPALMVFVYSSAIAIPTLCAFILTFLEFIASDKNVQPNTPLFYLMNASGTIGLLTGFIAITALFWHFSVLASLFFMVSILVWFYFLYRYVFRKYHPSNTSLNRDVR